MCSQLSRATAQARLESIPEQQSESDANGLKQLIQLMDEVEQHQTLIETKIKVNLQHVYQWC